MTTEHERDRPVWTGRGGDGCGGRTGPGRGDRAGPGGRDGRRQRHRRRARQVRRARRDRCGGRQGRRGGRRHQRSGSTADELVATADGLGGLSIVVNNAGITRDRMLFNMSDEDWDAVIAVHLRGHFLLTRNAAVYWRDKAKANDGTVYGRIVNTSSEAGLAGPVGQANYGAAKAGITALDVVGGPRARPLRRPRQRDRAAGPDGDDRRRVRRGAGAGRRAGRRLVARARGHAGAVPVVAGRRKGSTASCSSSMVRR